ncbi:hypothetical protein [Rhizobium rhizogenes]|uniref:hypothetical protein n=1 Tax=Rhizobium rhizogenes TaxID=359 RepID=UPI00080FECAC|nr:hypothetical protein [Rhizobium rhizogenes]NTF42588.1 hypothetical protein [Rhizobium rhizogenes]OCJ65655.1 hypothetical protein A6U96_07505 [Agrobacterium tumefaciens]
MTDELNDLIEEQRAAIHYHQACLRLGAEGYKNAKGEDPNHTIVAGYEAQMGYLEESRRRLAELLKEAAA